MNRKIKANEGFTLAELLIVVAIIAVLVAVSIPIFTSQLEKARESTDVANFRAAKAELIAKYLSEDGQIDQEGYYNASQGIFVTDYFKVGEGYGKGTTIPGSTSAADAKGYIDGFYNINLDYTGGVIGYNYTDGKLFMMWFVPKGGAGGVDDLKEQGNSFVVEPNKN